jgi:hypothetical protein
MVAEPERPFSTDPESEPAWLRDALAPPRLDCEQPQPSGQPIQPRPWRSLDTLTAAAK